MNAKKPDRLIFLAKFMENLQRLYSDQRFRFLVAGCANTTFSTLVYSALVFILGERAPAASYVAIAWALAIGVFFFVYRFWVFRASGDMWVDFIRFCGVNAAGLLVNVGAVALLVDACGLPAIPAQVCITITIAVFNYFAHKYLSFRRR